MKKAIKITALCLSLLAIEAIQAISLSDTWAKAKEKAYRTKENISNRLNNLDESTKNAIIGGGIATAGTAAVAGAGYAGYKAFNDKEEGASSYATGPSLEDILAKQSAKGSGKTVEQEAAELWQKHPNLSKTGPLAPPLPARDNSFVSTKTPPPAAPSRPTTFNPVPVLPIAPSKTFEDIYDRED